MERRIQDLRVPRGRKRGFRPSRLIKVSEDEVRSWRENNSLNKVRVKDRGLFAEDLRRIYRVETEEEAKEGILRLKERWGKIYPKVVSKWEDKAYVLLRFLRYPKEIRQFIYATNQIDRIGKEIKRRMKVIEVFPDEGSVERLLYLILKDMNERLNSRRLRGFNGIELGNYHALSKDVFTQ